MIFTICYNKYNLVPFYTIPDNLLVVIILDILDIWAYYFIKNYIIQNNLLALIMLEILDISDIWAYYLIKDITFKYNCSVCSVC